MNSVLKKLMTQMIGCGRYTPIKPAKYRTRNKQRQRKYRCVGCGEVKWFDVTPRAKTK